MTQDAASRAAEEAAPEPEKCEWDAQNEWEDSSDDRCWNTGCGHEYVLMAGNIPDDFCYCPYCGKEVETAAPIPADGEEPR